MGWGWFACRPRERSGQPLEAGELAGWLIVLLLFAVAVVVIARSC